ncbi:hypothetical protein EDB19DRAFT_1753471 [Suillus lakei]|nr:hypothetical protein EDB19DRAFT_1753471 [Suillus lakei]
MPRVFAPIWRCLWLTCNEIVPAIGQVPCALQRERQRVVSANVSCGVLHCRPAPSIGHRPQIWWYRGGLLAQFRTWCCCLIYHACLCRCYPWYTPPEFACYTYR